MQLINSNTLQVDSHTAGKGHAQACQAYTSVKRGSFCAFKAAWKRQELMEMTSQTMKKEDDVMDESQTKTWAPAPDQHSPVSTDIWGGGGASRPPGIRG